MADYLVQGASLTAVADAIRAKTGGTEKITLDQMPEAITGIRTSGTYQEKSVIPTGKEIVVAADSGYDALSKVTVAGDDNLKPWNLPEGITIYGVTGTMKINATSEIPEDLPVGKDDADKIYKENVGEAPADTGDLMVLVSSSGNITYGYLAEDFTITEFNLSTTDFKASGWRRLSYHVNGPLAGTWTYDDFSTEASGGMNYIKNIRSCSREKLYYNGVEIWPNMAGKLWNIQKYGDSNGDGSPDTITAQKQRFANGVFVTVRYSNRGNSADGFWSEDGINWNKVSMPIASYWYGVCYGGGRWIAWTQGNGSSRPCYTAYSDDNGKSWTAGGTLPTDGDGNYITMGKDTVVYADGKFLCRTGKGVVYSSDGGETWQFIAHETALHDMEHIIFNGERYVGINAYRGYATYSDDGFAWSDVELPVKGVSDGGFAFGAGKFVFTPLASTTCLYSKDGVTWEASTIAGSVSGISITGQWDVAYGDGLFIAATYLSERNGFLVTCRSTDGITWDEPFLSKPMVIGPDVVFANGKFYAFGSSNVAVCSVS